MSIYYNRRYSIFLDNDLFIEGGADRQFKITFNIRVEFGASHSYADIAIYNLSANTINKIKAGQYVKLLAGYVDNTDLLFSGAIINIFKERVGPDVITRFIAFSRGAANQSVQQPYTLPEQTTVLDVITACAAEMNLPLVITQEDFEPEPALLRGFRVEGDPVVLLSRFARDKGFFFVIESGKIVVIARNKSRAGEPHVVSEQTGMSSIPEITEIGCDVTVRINPKIKIGHAMIVKSELRTFNFSAIYFKGIKANDGTGLYTVRKLQHSGDSWGDSWDTKLTGYRI
jgi:hypothetical protein